MSKAVIALKDCISAMNEAVHHLESVQAAVPSALRGTHDALKPGHIYDLKTATGQTIGLDPRVVASRNRPDPHTPPLYAAEVAAFSDRLFVGGKATGDDRKTQPCPPPRDVIGPEAYEKLKDYMSGEPVSAKLPNFSGRTAESLGCSCSPSDILVEQLRTAIFRTESADLGPGGKRLQQLVLLALTHYEADVETF